jgi:hypothetical protein
MSSKRCFLDDTGLHSRRRARGDIPSVRSTRIRRSYSAVKRGDSHQASSKASVVFEFQCSLTGYEA